MKVIYNIKKCQYHDHILPSFTSIQLQRFADLIKRTWENTKQQKLFNERG